MTAVTAWDVHNVDASYPAPRVPWDWNEPVCRHHKPEATIEPATGIVWLFGQWQPMCQEGLANFARYHAPFAVPARWG